VNRRRAIVIGALSAVIAAATSATLLATTPWHHAGEAAAAPSAEPGTSQPPRPPAPTVARSPSPAPRRPAVHGVPAAGASSLVATLSTSVARFSTPGGEQTGVVPGRWFGAPSSLPVIAQDDGYLEVRLAQRPNGSTAWIASGAAALSATPYRIVVDLATEHLMLYKLGRLIMDAPAGIGTAGDPTPTGNFFVAFYASPPAPAWGPFILVTSGHSTAISDWEQSGDAIVAIHGPLGAGAAIGTRGARVSHGCVRLHDDDLQQLRVVPAGSPVTIVA
jgi:lipoprotein-anchoring transpeptidase ErfK/SrfK